MLVRSKNVTDHYDVNLSGWLRANGQYWYFKIKPEIDIFDHSQPLDYDVFEITDRKVKARALNRVRTFRHCVGWHFFNLTGYERRHRGGVKPGSAEWYKKNGKAMKLDKHLKWVGDSRDLINVDLER
jgi:hypothetical protein